MENVNNFEDVDNSGFSVRGSKLWGLPTLVKITLIDREEEIAEIAQKYSKTNGFEGYLGMLNQLTMDTYRLSVLLRCQRCFRKL